MIALKVSKRLAEKAKALLRDKGILARHIAALRDDSYVYFPIHKKASIGFGKIVDKTFQTQVTGAISLKDAVGDKLTGEEKEHLVSSFDVVGDIAIIEVRPELWKKRKIIAGTLLKTQKRVKVVLAKKSAMKGEYRVREFHHLAGPRRFTALYKESGCVMFVNLAKVYFSVRLSTERTRIANLVKENENVLVPFAGVGPFALVIARKHLSAKVVAVELNPFAFKQLKENVELNGLHNVVAIKGDAAVVLKNYVNWADRVAMPLPHTGETFLDAVVPCVKKGGVIHFYGFGPIEEPFKVLQEKIKEKCREQNRFGEVVFKRVVRPYAPKIVQVVLDVKIS